MRTCGHDADRAGARALQLALVALDDLQRVGLHGAAGIRLGGVGDDQQRAPAVPAPGAPRNPARTRSPAAPRRAGRAARASSTRDATRDDRETRRSRQSGCAAPASPSRARDRRSPARTWSTSVRIAKPNRTTCRTGMSMIRRSVRRSRRMWHISLRSRPRSALTLAADVTRCSARDGRFRRRPREPHEHARRPTRRRTAVFSSAGVPSAPIRPPP